MIVRSNWKFWKSQQFELFYINCDLPIFLQKYYAREFSLCISLFNTTLFHLSASRENVYLTLFEIQFIWGKDAKRMRKGFRG